MPDTATCMQKVRIDLYTLIYYGPGIYYIIVCIYNIACMSKYEFDLHSDWW